MSKDVILIPLEKNRQATGYFTILPPASAGDDPLSPLEEQVIYWYDEARQLREVLRIFYDKVRTVSLDPKFDFVASDLARAQELLT